MKTLFAAFLLMAVTAFAVPVPPTKHLLHSLSDNKADCNAELDTLLKNWKKRFKIVR